MEDNSKTYRPPFRRDSNWRLGNNEDSLTTSSGRGSSFFTRNRNRGHDSTYARSRKPDYGNARDKHNFNEKFAQGRSMSFMFLENLMNSDPEKIILTLVKERKGFSELLEKELSSDLLVLVVTILKKVSSSAFSDTKYNILHSSFNEKFINKLLTFIACVPAQDAYQKRTSKYFWNNPDEFLGNLVFIFEDFLNTTPTYACKTLPGLLNSLKIYIPLIEQVHLIQISDDIKNKVQKLQDVLQIVIKENEDNLKSSGSAKSEKNSEPPDDFRHISVYPTPEEIVGGRGFLRENVVKGPYKNVDDYLDVQFRLLREDFVGPLRDGIANFRSSIPSNHMDTVKVHKGVYFLNNETVNELYCLRVCFSKSKKKSNFEHSRRFMYGSLLCFTKDSSFQNLIFGKVAQRKIEDLNKGELIVGFDEKPTVQFNSTYLMVECGVYFEPYFHVLTVLKTMTTENFPMERYLIRVNSSVQPPEYLLDFQEDYEIGNVQFKLLTEWPSENFYNLNESQMVAFKAAITQEITVIQGPPGTGKTYLGLKIAQTLLENANAWYSSTPILVICYTNHALDQFLEGLIPITHEIVRVGGQSKNANLERYNLRNKTERDHAVALKRRKVQDSLHEIKRITEELEQISFYNSVVGFHNFRVVIPGFDSTWFGTAKEDSIIRWLLEGADRGHRSRNDLQALQIQEEFNRIGINDEVEEKKMGNQLNDELDEHTTFRFETLFDEVLHQIGRRRNFLLVSLGSRRDQIQNHQNTLLRLMEVQDPSLQQMIQEEELQIHLEVLKQQFDYLKRHLAQGRLLEEVEEPKNINLHRPHTIDFETRWQLYFYWLNLYKRYQTEELKVTNQLFHSVYKEYEELRQIEDVRAMKNALVVGMTTTSAARLRSSLQTLKNPIVIVEEAAEVLEAHIVTSITKHCQHLILIGDHKQLKPTTANYSMEKQYRLGISLFERMLINDIHCYTLNVQHRMRPEISCLIRPTIYDFLEDHPSVLQRPAIKGVDNCVFFIDHDHPEESCEGSSKTNHHEVSFLIYLARHLVLNGHNPEKITILAAYLGQFFEFTKMKKGHLDLLDGMKIAVLDNYQGEESDIILLSLVRNNEENKIGFLSIENRVCVALSRARNGMYIMGNMGQLSSNSELWKKIKSILEKQNSLGTELPLRCQIHQAQVTNVKCETDFFSISEGGCNKKCDADLKCGHKCTSLCHIRDTGHHTYKCKSVCDKQLCPKNEAHVCKKLCYEICGPCTYMVQHTLKCSHEVNIQCHIDPETYKCPVPVSTVLPCGHTADKPCYYDPETFRCPHICEVQVQPCGHACILNCHIRNDPDHLQYKCQKECTKFMKDCSLEEEDHRCKKLCFQECDPCTIKVRKQRFCKHFFDVFCNSDVDEIDCDKPCTKKLQCGHLCKGRCNEPCKPCNLKVTKTVPLCGHEVKVKCCEPPIRGYCNKPCPLKLTCGHPCTKRCNEPCTTECTVLVESSGIKSECGHLVTGIECYMTNTQVDPKSLLKYCTHPCTTELKCGHPCSGTCGECIQGRIHKRCSQKCGTLLVCDHECTIPCRQACRPCKKVCHYKCQHSVCSKTCGEVCTPCKEHCSRRCQHQWCSKYCGDICSVPPCTESCSKVLKCGHRCIGFCGDPCPPKCLVCNKEELLEVFFGTESEDAKYVFLNDCKHVVENTGMEQWLQMNENQISYKVCPKCKTAIRTTQRYRDYIKKAIRDIAQVKEKINGKKEEITQKQQEINLVVKQLNIKAGSLHIYCPQILTLIKNIHSRVQSNKKGRRANINIFEVDTLQAKLLLLEDVLNVCCNENVRIQKAELFFPQVDLIIGVLLRDAEFITNQEIEDLSLEITRLSRIVDFSCLRKAPQFSYLVETKETVKNLFATIEELIFGCNRFTHEDNEILKLQLTELNEIMKGGLAISDRERKEILQAMGFSKGHWFKCPNGHIYAIGECGGAMQEGNCNECGARIGGSSHRLLDTNAVATEMDGAVQGAWSMRTDLRNYQL